MRSRDASLDPEHTRYLLACHGLLSTKGLGVRPVFKTVDTCAAEFAAYTPYHYGTYEDEDEVANTGANRRTPRERSGTPQKAGDFVWDEEESEALRQAQEQPLDTLLEAREDKILGYGKFKELNAG